MKDKKKSFQNLQKKKKICEICKESHPTLIHGYIPKLRSYSIHQTSKETISMSIVPVRISHQSDETHELKVYALLDENSQGTFIHEALLDKLPVIKRCTSITTETINGFNTDSSFAIDGLVVKPLKEFENAYYPVKIPLPTSYSREVISCHGEEVPTTERIKKWSHLQSIFNKLPDYDPSILLGIIIGANCPKALESQKRIPSIENGPYASRSVLGWRVIGPITGGHTNPMRCIRNRVQIPMVDSSTNTPARSTSQR